MMFTTCLIAVLIILITADFACAIEFPTFKNPFKKEKQKSQETNIFSPEEEPEFTPDLTIPETKQEDLQSSKDIIDVGDDTSKKDDETQGKIEKIEFEGNKLIKNSDLMKVIKMQSGDIYSREMVQQNLKAIYSMGYFSKKMRAVPYRDEKGNVTLKIYLEENIPIEGFTIEGNTVLKQGDILDVINELEGQPQNTELINLAIQKIEELYASQGYILARVTEISDDPDGIVNINIQEGIIKSIDFRGNKKTKDFVVKRNILTEIGTVYNENIIKADLMRIYATQAFKNVDRTIAQDEEEPEKYNITIELEEQRTGVLNLGAGIDTVTGFFATLGFSENNFLGRGQKLGLNAMAGTGIVMSDAAVLNRANWQIEASWFEPRLRGTENSLMVKGFFRDFASYQVPLAIEQRYGGEFTFSRPVKSIPNLTASLGIGAENVNVREGDFAKISGLYNKYLIPISERAEQLRGGIFATISPSLVYDTRDSAIMPRSGAIATTRMDIAVGLTDFNSTHTKVTAGLKQYFPVAKKSTFLISARGGGVIMGMDDMPEVMAYRLGGPYTVRGFNMSGVGTGGGFMMASAELQTPVLFLDRIKKVPFLNNIRLGFFADAGRVFNGTITNVIYNRPEQAITIGAGLRVFIPGVGPLNVDYGYPITNIGDGNRRGIFTFGVGEFY